MKRTVYFIFTLLSLTISAFVCPTWAEPSCSGLLELTNVEAQSHKIAQFLSSRAYDRLIRTQPESLKTVPEQIVTAPEGRTNIIIDEDNVRSSLYVTKAKGTINIEIKYISFRSGEKGIGRTLKSLFSMGKQNPSLNMAFPRVIAAIASGLERVIVADPSLKTVSITGTNVVNLALTRQLREFGFKPGELQPYGIFFNALRREGLYAAWIHVLASWTGLISAMPDYVYVPLKVVKNAVIVSAAFRYKDLGRNWTIEFQVEREVGTGE